MHQERQEGNRGKQDGEGREGIKVVDETNFFLNDENPSDIRSLNTGDLAWIVD